MPHDARLLNEVLLRARDVADALRLVSEDGAELASLYEKHIDRLERAIAEKDDEKISLALIFSSQDGRAWDAFGIYPKDDDPLRKKDLALTVAIIAARESRT